MEKLPPNPGEDRRRSQRLLLHLAIEIEGENKEGQPVNETAEAVAASKHGALLKSRSKLRTGSTIRIRNPENSEHGEFKVIWTSPAPLEGIWNVGIEVHTGESPLWDSSS